jgi:hypothetical protein
MLSKKNISILTVVFKKRERSQTADRTKGETAISRDVATHVVLVFKFFSDSQTGFNTGN